MKNSKNEQKFNPKNGMEAFSPTPPPLPPHLPPLPDSPQIIGPYSSISPNVVQSTVLVLPPQDPPLRSDSSSPLSTSELLKAIKSSQVDLKKSLGMIESIVERTNEVQRMCEALKKSPTRKTDPTATSLPSNIAVVGPTDGHSDTISDDDDGDSVEGEDVVDEINRSFVVNPTVPSAGQATMHILLTEIRTLIREIQMNRRIRVEQGEDGGDARESCQGVTNHTQL